MVSIQLAAGCLIFRLADGFARNALFANQITLFQSLCGFGSNTAQRAAKILSAACSVAPLLLGAVQSHFNLHLPNLVLVGCFLEAFCTAVAALRGAAPMIFESLPVQPRPILLVVGICFCYALAYGAVTSAMPTMTRKSAPEGSLCTGLMQAFVAFLSAGAIAGIAAAALAHSFHEDHLALFSAVVVLLLGICFIPPLGGTPLSCARRILRWAGIRKEDLVTWENDEVNENTANASRPESTPLMPLLWRLMLCVPFYEAAVQWTTSWYVQTLYVDRTVAGFVIPACLLQAFERASSLATLTLLRATFVLKLKTSTRLALGSLLAAMAMFVSAYVECWRRDWTPRLPGHPAVSSLSILWLLPQFALIAAAEAFIYPASAEFLSTSAFAYGLGCAVHAAAVASLGVLLGHLKEWIPESSPNEGHYDKFYLSLGSACLVGTLLLIAFPFSATSA